MLPTQINMSHEMTSVPDGDGEASISTFSTCGDVLRDEESTCPVDENEGTAGGGGGPKQDQDELPVAKNENRAVWCLRFLVMFLLSSVALAICLSVYFTTSVQQKNDFEVAFEEVGVKVVESFELTLRQRVGIMENFAMDITAYENNTPNVTFPFVTLPQFETRAGSIGKLADIMSAGFWPIITAKDRQAWDAYSTNPANQAWLAEGIAVRTGISLEQAKAQVTPSPIPPSIWGIFPGQDPPLGPETRPGPYCVQWSAFPATTTVVYNMNLATHPAYAQSIKTLLQEKQAVFPPSYDFIDPATHTTDPRRPMIESFLDSYESYGTGAKYEDDPVLPLLLPVFDRIGGEVAERKVAGIVVAGVYWKTYFRNLLPAGTNGIRVILSNSCGQQYTYSVDGKEARFLGFGSLHDPKYEDLAKGVDLGQTLMLHRDTTAADSEGSSSNGNCRYQVRVYPSQDFEDTYVTPQPMVYTLALASVFLFTSAVFLLYDYCVERRQRLVLHEAQKSGNLVSSLFPEVVRDRLFEEREANNKRTTNNWNVKDETNQGAAIANLYPETTVLFADLAGFTAWSAKRSPTEVFELLEALYSCFDRIAERRRVFKVETIGDCYVAATGLPNPQERHAVIMSRFANDCMIEMNQVTADLVDKLGDDTKDLEMRVGLHSGSTTAGVLRGTKGRFQLFGDTVNTASRMESSGVRGRIHVSQATADALIKAGKENWLVPREDKVEAKGKGLMQTYFVLVTPGKATTGRSSNMDLDQSLSVLHVDRVDKISFQETSTETCVETSRQESTTQSPPTKNEKDHSMLDSHTTTQIRQVQTENWV